MYNFPALDVIVPAYNVEEYLEGCVKSILAADYPSLKVTIVDDGSGDGTGQVADDLGSRYPEKVEVIHQENGGLSAARNTGIRATSNPYIAFVDADDKVSKHGYSKMATSMQRSGSKMAVGAVHRFNSKREWAPWFVDEAHSIDRLSVTGNSFPPILWNVFAWSKLFEREFFLRVAGEFPVGMLYEDQEVSAKLYLSGEPFDILSDVVYYWREREDGSSITENKIDVYDLEQRLEVARATERVIRELGDTDVVEYWYRKLLNEDLWWYFRVVRKASSQYWDTLCDGVAEFAERAPSTALVGGPSKRKDLLRLALRRNRGEFHKRLAKP
ncbi:MAG: glycosyltransferase family 2 protein [Corynebacterium sp.]|nr:glycosyltransferase family 2 protein [Corynebacterium sp.]